MFSRLLLFSALASIAFAAPESRLANVSVRSHAGTGSETLIVGFVVGGSGQKNVLLRGVGPSLVPLGVSNVVTDPQIALFSGAKEIDRNGDWGGGSLLTEVSTRLGAFPLGADSKDAALASVLSPGPYTVHLVAASNTGVGLLECYDADEAGSDASLVNISARSWSGAGDDVLIIGFVITGTAPKTLLIRGVGPTLAQQNVTGVLQRTQLRLFDHRRVQIAHGVGGWDYGISPVFTSVGAFPLPGGSQDSVLFLALPPGVYTAHVAGYGSATGTALIEAYAVENSPIPFVTMQPVTAAALEPPDDSGAGTPSAGPDVSAKAQTKITPHYPFDLVRAGITGEVLVDFYVKSDGTVANAIAVDATDIRLADASVTAVSQWIFVPGRKDGKLVTTHLQQPIIFSIEEG
jgi:TonB family protein